MATTTITTTTTAADRIACPECGAPLFIDEGAAVETPIFRQGVSAMPFVELVMRPAVVAFCSGCEFSHEITERRIA